MVWRALKTGKGGKSVLDYLPFTIDDLKRHLEAQFDPWMSWENYGEWHLDHIKPRCLFRYSSMDDPIFRECWALSNLRPLRSVDNCKKGANVINTIRQQPEGRSPKQCVRRK
jgi:hypothetical protein